jgi:hypothetical protein
MKKTLAIILALALVFSSFTVAFAEEVLPADAAAVTGLGMLVGAGNGVTLDYLKVAPTRIQAAIMVLRLKGLEDDAKAFTGVDNFADANTAAWATPIMAYLKANPTLGFAGTGGANFEPNTVIDAKSYYKVMLETLGYKQNTTSVIGDFTFEGVFEFAATKGLSKIASVTSFTVNDLATATIEALKANIKGSEKTLAASLVDAKVITEAAAVAAGVYNLTPVVLAVESVTTNNLKQLSVKFNKEIKAAGDEDNYSVDSDDAVVVIDDESDYTLLADKKTVVITLTHEADQQEEIDLAIEGIVAVDGSKLADTIVEDVMLFDNTIPTALSAKVIGNDTIKVTFSEPIEVADQDSFKIDGGDIIVKEINPVNNNTELNVVLYSELEEGTVKIEALADIEDYAGFGIPKKAFDIAVVEDTTAPTIVGYEDATPKGVTLIFNEDIQLVDGIVANFYHTNSENTVMDPITDLDIDGNKLELDFYTDADTNNLLPEGTAYVYVAKEAIADLWDNENSKLTQTVQVELDKTKPTVTKVEAGDTESELVVTFSEKMDVDTVEDEDNYTVLDKDGKVVADIISSVALDTEDEDFVTVTFTEDLTGDYSIVIADVEDQNENAIVKVTMAFNITDVTAPLFADFSAKLYKAGTTKQMLKVSFDEAMAVTGKYSVLDLEKYNFNDVNLEDVEDATIKAVDGNKAVEIVLPYVLAEANTHFSASDDLFVARVADAAGNYTVELSERINPSKVLAAGTVIIEKDDSDYTARLTSKDTIVVTLNDRLTTFNSDDFIIRSLGVELDPSRIRHTINEDGLSTITFTLVDDVNTNANTVSNLATPYNITINTNTTTTSKNIYGEFLATGDSATIIDKAKPTLEDAVFVPGVKDAEGNVVDGQYSTIILTFSEALRANTFATGKNGFSVTGGTLSSATLTAPNQVTLTSTGTFFTVNTNVNYNTIAGIKDLNGNSMADFAETAALLVDEE